MGRTKEKPDVVYTVKKPKNNDLVWRPVSSQASFAEGLFLCGWRKVLHDAHACTLG